jgi:Phage integrase family
MFAPAAEFENGAPSYQKKTGRPVQFEITEQTRASVEDWLSEIAATKEKYLFPSRLRAQPHLSTRQYARIVHTWVESAGLDSSAYGTHTMRRTKAAQIYKKTANLRAGSASARAHEARKYGALPRYRGRRRSEYCGAGRDLNQSRSAVLHPGPQTSCPLSAPRLWWKARRQDAPRGLMRLRR